MTLRLPKEKGGKKKLISPQEIPSPSKGEEGRISFHLRRAMFLWDENSNNSLLLGEEESSPEK